MDARTIRYCAAALLTAALLLPGAVEGAPAPKVKKARAHAQVSAGKSSAKKSKRRVRRVRGQKAPAGDRIKEIQEALAKSGAYSGKPSGKWDGATVEAMKRFQAGQGLNPTGKMDAKSLQKLGLGSEIAGLAAPLPVQGSPAGDPEGSRNPD